MCVDAVYHAAWRSAQEVLLHSSCVVHVCGLFNLFIFTFNTPVYLFNSGIYFIGVAEQPSNRSGAGSPSGYHCGTTLPQSCFAKVG